MIAPATNPTMSSSALQLLDLHKRFGVTPIIRGLNLDVKQVAKNSQAINGPDLFHEHSHFQISLVYYEILLIIRFYHGYTFVCMFS